MAGAAWRALGLVSASSATSARNVVVVPGPRPHTASVAFVLPPFPSLPASLICPSFSAVLVALPSGWSSDPRPLAEAGRMGRGLVGSA
jgi:hypothetical protein